MHKTARLCEGMCFLQLDRAVLAADLNGPALNGDGDGAVIQFAITCGTCSFCHGCILPSPVACAQEKHEARRAAIKIFRYLALKRCLPVEHRCTAKGTAERGRKMAVARKAEIVTERGQVVIPVHDIKRPREPKLRLVAV